jgi:transposase-like protein
MSEMTKDGAVRCPGCGSDDVSMVKTASKEVSEGVENLIEKFVCRSCNRPFSKGY